MSIEPKTARQAHTEKESLRSSPDRRLLYDRYKWLAPQGAGDQVVHLLVVEAGFGAGVGERQDPALAALVFPHFELDARLQIVGDRADVVGKAEAVQIDALAGVVVLQEKHKRAAPESGVFVDGDGVGRFVVTALVVAAASGRESAQQEDCEQEQEEK